MPQQNGHTERGRAHPAAGPRARPVIATPPPGRGRRERAAVPVVVPATLWAPPAYATGPGWSGWVRATVRRSFLSPSGRWWDMPTAFTDPAPDGHAPSPAPAPFWAALIDAAPPPLAAPDGHGGPADATVTESAALPAPGFTSAGSVAAADVVFADLTSAGVGVDGQLGMIAARALRRGGILAVLTRCRPPEPGGALLDPTGAIVASAQNADLLYLQHIVIPTAPLRPPPPNDTDAVQPDVDRPGGHVVAHVDLLVFAQPGKHGGAHTYPATEPVSLEATRTEPTGAPR